MSVADGGDGPGEQRESVWDYPRPPRVEPCRQRVRVEHCGGVVAESERALRVLETASPPTIYVPREDVSARLEEIDGGHTVCEWKGRASYCDVATASGRVERAAFFYANPRPGYEQLRDHVSFYPGRLAAAYLDDERVRPQPGSFYAGWVTDAIEGPFKGEPGTEGW